MHPILSRHVFAFSRTSSFFSAANSEKVEETRELVQLSQLSQLSQQLHEWCSFNNQLQHFAAP
jgi:hypothetical protein